MKKTLIVTSGLLLLLADTAVTAFAGDPKDGAFGMGAAAAGEMKAAGGAAAQEEAEQAGAAGVGAAREETAAAAEGAGAAAEGAGAAAEGAGAAAEGAGAAAEGAGGATVATESPLVHQLTSELGVTQRQALGGAGAIFSVAKQNLQPSEFGQISSAVPNMDSYLEAAPRPKTLGGMFGALGGQAGKVGKTASLVSSFSQLGLSADMVGKFTPVVLQYVQAQGGSSAMTLLQGAIQ
jgi:hypothetical protein